MRTDENREFWEEFINLYKSFPCLWDVKSKAYMNRNSRTVALKVLVHKCIAVYPSANKDFVTKKIHNMRSAFRKELRKMKESKRTGAAGDSTYRSTLWYFDLLSFLTDSDIPQRELENVQSSSQLVDANDELDNANMDAESEVNTDATSGSTPTASTSRECRTRKRNRQSSTSELLTLTRNALMNNAEKDSMDLFGKKIALDMKKMTDTQRILTEKLIGLIICKAKFQELTHNTCITENPITNTTPD